MKIFWIIGITNIPWFLPVILARMFLYRPSIVLDRSFKVGTGFFVLVVFESWANRFTG
jgi:hypothetical protein